MKGMNGLDKMNSQGPCGGGGGGYKKTFFVSLPLPEAGEWNHFEQSRQEIGPQELLKKNISKYGK